MKNINKNLLSISGLCLILLTVLFAVSQAHAQGGSIVVNTIAEGDDGACNEANCTLREAVKYAPAGATITFSVTGTITLTPGSFLPITRSMTITGPGAGLLSVNGNQRTRIFRMSSGVVGISGLTLTNGSANSEPGGTGNVVRGGAIYLVGGDLTVTDCILSGSNAVDGGGGIYVNSGSLTVASSTVSGNFAGSSGAGGGGGIVVAGGSVVMTESTLSGNTTSGVGGGIYLRSGTSATVRNSTISANRSTSLTGGGGGVFNNGNLTITQCTISGNSTTAYRLNTGVYGGAGIFNNAVLSISASTITANNSENSSGGGGINTQSNPLTMSNTIVAGNTAASGMDIEGTVSAGDYNLMQSTPGATLSGTHNITGQPVMLGSLGDNGGPTRTHTLLGGSPAINAGDPAFDAMNTPNDQRGIGFPRVQNGRIDIGAYESETPQSGSNFIVNTLADTDDGICGPTNCTLREAVKSAPADSVISFSVMGTVILTGGEMVIAKNLTILGPTTAPGITVSGNRVSRIFRINSGTVNLSLLTLSGGNGVGASSSGSGGAIYISGGTVTIASSTLSGNSATSFGGALVTGGGVVTVANSTFSGNSAATTGGAIRNIGTLTIADSTFSGNSATTGGGIHNSTPLNLSNTIVAGNSATNNPDLFGTVASGDYNLVQNTSGATLSGTHNVTGQPALLGPLANNGGPTQTHALLAESPAIDQGSSTGTDQRGLTRPVDNPSIPNAADGNGADIGAFELQIAMPADLTVVKSHAGNFTQGDTGKTYSIAVTNSGGTPTSGSVSVTDTLPAGLTATAISGNGWTCTLGTLICTRGDALAAMGNYPSIILTVDVDNNASASVTNTATVSGGGETNTANNQGVDLTTINAAPRYSISGTVKYGTTNVGQPDSFVSGVNLNATGTVSASAISDSGGNYFISNLLGGSYTVTPWKTGDVKGINSLDATRIQQHLVGMTTLSANQLIAADTDGNGTVNSLDATRIQQSLIGMNTPNIIGQWKFIPASRQYNALDANQTGQDYHAVLVGEVSGNWASAASPTNNFQTEENEILPETNERKTTAERFADDFSGRIAENTKQSFNSAANESITELLSPAADIQVSLPTNAISSTGSTVTIPITISQIPAGSSIESFDFSVFYDPAVLQPALTVGSNAGTLSANCSVLPFSPVAGRVIVSGACAQAITTGSGVLYNLTFNVIGASGQTTSLSFVNPANNNNTFQFNNSTPTVSASNGQFNVLAPTAASVSVAGRVLTGAGRGLMNATIVLTDSNGNTRSVRTGAFGYYRFTDVQAGETYILSATAKRYTFSQPSRVLNLNEDANEVYFIASSENRLKDFQSEN